MRYVLMLLLIVAAPARAEWVKVDVSEDSSFYIDPATIRRDGEMVAVWQLQDLKQSRSGVMSLRVLSEDACKEKRFRVLAVSGYSGSMLSGDVISSPTPSGKWDHIPADTVGATILRLVCAK